MTTIGVMASHTSLSNSPPAEKLLLRGEIIRRIEAMSPSDRRDQDILLRREFPTLPGYLESSTVLLYVAAFREEIPTRPFWEMAIAAGKRVLFPRIARKPRRLQLFEVRDLESDLIPGPLGIREPREDLPEIAPKLVDWALIPGLAFDREGYRLGRGGGYYDRLIPSLRQDAICWGLGYDCQLVESIPREVHDAPLNGVLVPTGSYRGSRSPSFE